MSKVYAKIIERKANSSRLSSYEKMFDLPHYKIHSSTIRVVKIHRFGKVMGNPTLCWLGYTN